MTHDGNLSPEFLHGCEDNSGLTPSAPTEHMGLYNIFSPFVKVWKKKKKEKSDKRNGCDLFTRRCGWKAFLVSLVCPWWVHVKRGLLQYNDNQVNLAQLRPAVLHCKRPSFWWLSSPHAELVNMTCKNEPFISFIRAWRVAVFIFFCGC